MFCAGSLPRKWSMRKICSSEKTSCSLLFSATALARSVPNGFSMMMRQRSTRPASASSLHRRQSGARRHAQIVQAAALAAERLLRRFDRRLERVRRRPTAAHSRGSRQRRPNSRRSPSRLDASSASRAILRNPSASISSSETPMIRQPGMNPALHRWNSPGSSLRRERSPVAPTSTTTCGYRGPTRDEFFATLPPRHRLEPHRQQSIAHANPGVGSN